MDLKAVADALEWRRPKLVAGLLIAGLSVASLCLAGCGDQGSSAGERAARAAVDATAAATGVCGVLVDFDHVVADEVNGASRQITGGASAEEARRLLLDATVRVQRATDDLADRYAALSLRDEGDIGRLVADATANADKVDAQLDLIRASLTDGLGGEGPRAILTATFIRYEKVQSLAQPEVDDYTEAALVNALDHDPACEHTVSR